MKTPAYVIAILAISLSACEPEATRTRPLPSEDRAAPTASEGLHAVLPTRRALARSLGDRYSITKMKVRQPGAQDAPSKVVDVIAHWEGPGHRRWGLTFEKWPTAGEAASEFKDQARAAPEPPESPLSRRYFCTSRDSGRSYCTVLVQDVILRVIPLPTKDQRDYPPVEHVTEVTGDTARVFRSDS